MKLRLSILLFAAALAAAPAAGQTIKSLGYNTTNGNVVAATNVTFTNSVGFATNARAETRTNLGGTTVGNSVFTATNAAAAATAIGLGTNNEVAFSRVGVGSAAISTNSFSGGDFAVTAGYALTFISGGVASTTRTNLGLGAANNVTFSNITASGTLTATGNVTMSGTANIAPSQTASSASSLMTRELTDTRMVDYIMQQPARFRNLSHSIQSYISGTGAVVHAGPIAEGRVNTRIVNGSTNSFAGIRVNRQGPWNGVEGNFGIEWARPMNVVVTGTKAISTNNVVRAFLVLGGGISDFDVPTNGNFVALNWTNSTNAQVIVGRAGVLSTNATIISTSATANFAIWIDHSTNGIGQIYYAEKLTGSNVQKPASPSASYTNGPAVTSDAGQISLNFGTVGLVTNTGGSFELVGLNNAIMFAP